MKRQTAIATLAITLILAASGCTPPGKASRSKHSDALIVLKGAEDCRFTNMGGADQTSYRLRCRYPAPEEIAEIYRQLDAKGWKPLKEDFLNPGLPSSHTRGWTDFLDGTAKPTRRVHQWLAQWQNENRDILWCCLKYSSPEDGQDDLDNLRVALSFIPSALAAESRKQALQASTRGGDMSNQK